MTEESRNKVGRPTKFTPEMADAIVKSLCVRGVVATAKELGIDADSIANWQAADAAFSDRCARAREAYADKLAEDIGDIEDQTLSGEIPPDVARVVLSSRQWRASKFGPGRYGDRTKVDVGGSVTIRATQIDEAL